MKKLVALLLAIVMVVGIFAGCNTEKPVETKPQETQGGNKPAETKPAETEKAFSHPSTTEPITITVLTTRHSQATNGPKDTYWFNHLEKWLHDNYGYNVTFDVTQTQEKAETLSLLLGTDSLPDIVWGINLSTSQAVVYGDSEGMILDLVPYMNDTYMPNFTAAMNDPANAAVALASTTPAGHIFGTPIISSTSYWTAASRLNSKADRLFYYMPVLEELGLEKPTSLEEFYALCEAVKGRKTADGQDMVPILCNSDYISYMERTFWTLLGFYGNEQSKYGTEFAIKNGEVHLPAYTDEYAKFIEVMNHLYTNGYLSPEYLTLGKDTVRGMTKAGLAGIVSDATMGSLNDFSQWESMPWFPINEGDQIAVTVAAAPRAMQTWVSASTEYPEVVALILDYLFTVEGSALYKYGPKKGEDPLNMVDGWYYNDAGVMTTKLVEDGTYEGFTSYCYQYIFSYTYVGQDVAILDTQEGKEYLDIADKVVPEHQILDTITGEYFTGYEKAFRDDATVGGHWYITNSAASEPYATLITLPPVYLSEDDALYASELYSVLENHIISESAKFITGTRPLSEIPAFQAELKGMGVEDYIELYRNAYASFMEGYFG